MTDPLPGPVPDPPELDPSVVAGANFTRVRKGFEPAEVHKLLGRTADALRTWQERDDRTSERIEELERRLSASQELDEERITTVLGEETARIVSAAREAAAEIRAKAEEQSERLVRESEENAAAAAAALTTEATALRDEAERTRDDAVAEAARVREESLADAARLREEADASATALRDEAATEATRVRDDAQAEATRLREDAQAEATRLREDAQLSHDEMLERAASVLEERSAEAESVAAGIREAADAELSTARVEAERIRSEAKEAALEEIDRARSEGREMVAEARQLRERMLRDLAERRRTARRQIEAARAGRDRIVESLREVGVTVDASISSLDAVDDDAQRAADAAAAAVDDDIDAVVAELDTGLSTGGLAPAGAETVDVVQVTEVTEVTEVVGTVEVGAATGPDDLQGEGVDEDDDGERSPGATVHDLFERIRAERSTDEPAGDSGELGPGGDMAAVAASGAGAEVAGAPEVVLDVEVVEVAVEEPEPEPEPVPEPDVIEVAGTEAVVAATSDGANDAGGATGTDDAPVVVSALDRRDELLAAPEKALARTLKRLVSDEQNEVLDRLRRTKRGRPELATLLPEGPDAERFDGALRAEFRVAAEAGVDFWTERSGDSPAGSLDDARLDRSLSDRVTELLGLRRAHVQRVLDDADASGLELAELGDHIRAAYREWRTQSVGELSGDLAAAGFAEGLLASAGPGTPWCWVPDNGGLPCSDAEDNSLAGEVACGEEFPTGDVIPPAHSGCRCILVPPSR